MIKKIMIAALLITLSGYNQVNAACNLPIDESCKADIGSGINTNLKDKILPDNISKLKVPNNSFDNRSQLGQPKIPSNINMEPIQEENTMPYDANCQFGNCFNRTNAGETQNF